MHTYARNCALNLLGQRRLMWLLNQARTGLSVFVLGQTIKHANDRAAKTNLSSLVAACTWYGIRPHLSFIAIHQH